MRVEWRNLTPLFTWKENINPEPTNNRHQYSHTLCPCATTDLWPHIKYGNQNYRNYGNVIIITVAFDVPFSLPTPLEIKHEASSSSKITISTNQTHKLTRNKGWHALISFQKRRSNDGTHVLKIRKKNTILCKFNRKINKMKCLSLIVRIHQYFPAIHVCSYVIYLSLRIS